MSRYFSYINSSKRILDTYDGMQPFPFHLKKQFAANKNFGSKDRRTISEICYAWLRTSHLFQQQLLEENLVKAFFLCAEVAQALLEVLDPVLNEKAGLPVREKLSILGLPAENIFPFTQEIGVADAIQFNESFLRQPLLFLRLRPGKEQLVLSKLQQAAISFIELDHGCIGLPNGSKLDEVISLNKEAVVQDKNSQRVFDFLASDAFTEKISVWDCCAASGGKSILLFDKGKGKIKLTVSDIRKTILHNCQVRLQEAGININHAFVGDITKDISQSLNDHFDLIICDAPCTGSGTWSRTPEQLAYFKKESIGEFSLLQKRIAGNALQYLKIDGLFFYITCSVFRKENEEVVAALLEDKSLQLLHSTYLPGYNERADSMFVAVIKKLG